MSVEQEFGRKIFNRSSRGMTLTPFGKLFIAYITPIHQQLTQLYAMRNPAAAGSSTPTLNIISNGFYYISDIVAAIGRRNASQGLRRQCDGCPAQRIRGTGCGAALELLPGA